MVDLVKTLLRSLFANTLNKIALPFLGNAILQI